MPTRFRNSFRLTRLLMLLSALAPRPVLHPSAANRPLLPAARVYQVSYRLKRAEMYLGQVKATFFVPCTRRFPTNELNIILAELYEEVGPAHNLMGIEILSIDSTFAAA